MALDANDLMTLKSMGMSPYEQFKVQNMQTKAHTSGIGVTGLVTGIVGTVVGVTAWIFAPLYGNAKAKEAKEAAYSAKELATIQNGATQRQLDQLTNLFAAERNERINGDLNITTTISDTLSGQQSGTLSQSQQLSNDITLGLMTGKYTETPQKVALYRDATPCGCPATGCNCMG